MNDYRQLRLDITPCSETATDIAAAMLADAGYESFVPDQTGLTAFIPAAAFDSEEVDRIIAEFPLPGLSFAVSEQTVEGRDWNSEWEKNYFQPIVIADRCVIHSSFHRDVPACDYDIVIDPKMAFGTGHHATTTLMLKRLLESDLSGLRVIDMGTGTGILAILASMKGAAAAVGIEIDPWAYANAIENAGLNGCTGITLVNGDASRLPAEEACDIFLANINRNVITADIGRYAATLARGGDMYLSGFYVEDIPVVEEAARRCGLEKADFTEMDRWACLHLRKP